MPSWVSELQVPPSVSGEPQVPPVPPSVPLEEPPDEAPEEEPDEEPDPEAPLEDDEPLEPDDAPELPLLDEVAPLDDVEASSVAPLSSVEPPELELELQANVAPAPSARSATHHPATGNAVGIVMSFRRAPLAREHKRFLGIRRPAASSTRLQRAQWCTCLRSLCGPPRARQSLSRRRSTRRITWGSHGAKSQRALNQRNPRGRQ